MTSMFRTRFSVLLLVASFLFGSVARAATLPNDPFYPEQWHLAKISAPAAWDVTTGNAQVVVAIIDTGVDAGNPDLAGNIWTNAREVPGDGKDNDGNGFIDDVHGWNFVERNNDTRPSVAVGASRAGIDHGTVLAGIVAALGNNHEGVAGISWHTRIMPIRALDSAGSGDENDIIHAIDYAVTNGASIINLSFTTPTNTPELSAAVKRAVDAGVLIVAAAGNDDGSDLDHAPVYPVCDDGPAGENWVLGVTSLGISDRRSSFANYGSLCVDLAAPGEDITSTQVPAATAPPGPAYGGGWSGTSFASPIVAGVAALVRSVAPTIDRNTLIDVLKRSAVSVDDLNPNYRGRLGFGRVDAFRALAEAQVAAQRQPVAQAVTHIAVSSDSGLPRVWVLDGAGGITSNFFAYAQLFRGGVRVAAGDVAADGKTQIVTVPGPGGGPQVRLFDSLGNVKNQFFAFTQTMRNGLTVAVGNVDPTNPGDEIIVGVGRGGRPTVRVFSGTGHLLSEFSAYATTFTGGVEVAVGDTDGDGTDEVITAPGAGGGPHVRVFDLHGHVKAQFFADDASYHGGLRVAAGNIVDGSNAEIIVTRATAAAPAVHVFSGTGTAIASLPAFAGATPLLTTAAVGRVSASALAEVFVGAVTSSSGEIHALTGNGSLAQVLRIPDTLRGIIRLALF